MCIEHVGYSYIKYYINHNLFPPVYDCYNVVCRCYIATCQYGYASIAFCYCFRARKFSNEYNLHNCNIHELISHDLVRSETAPPERKRHKEKRKMKENPEITIEIHNELQCMFERIRNTQNGRAIKCFF